MKIIEAIQEACGPEYTTLEDAINWWSGPRAWREDFTAVLILRSGKAKLTKDITINEGVLDSNGDLNTNTTFDKWKPVGTLNRPFIGTFDGDGHTIRGLYVNVNENYVGLFGCVGAGGTVKNVTIADSYVSGKVNVGDICGRNDGGIVENCTSGCTVKGTGNAVGGICGSNQRGDHVGRVLNCHNTGKVSGKNRVGGVCGGGDDSTNCYYLDTSAETSKGGTAKTAAEFKSDYVAYLLQQALNDAAPGTTAAQVWGRRIGTDDYPVLSSDAAYTVYKPLKSALGKHRPLKL